MLKTLVTFLRCILVRRKALYRESSWMFLGKKRRLTHPALLTSSEEFCMNKHPGVEAQLTKV